MLVTVAAFATTLLTQQPVDKPTLELYQQRFVVRVGNDVVRVPLRESAELVPAVLFRRDNHYAVWDERGLTARSGSWNFASRLAEFPTSSRFFQRAQVLETLELVRRGTRRLEASGVSGAKRIGNRAYFLARWDDAGGKPWQEALVSVDLDGLKPKPRFIGRFEGLSTARALIDNRVAQVDGGLEVVTQGEEGWGIAKFDPKSEAFTFRRLGDRLQGYVPLSPSRGLFVETTSFGTTAAGEADLVSGKMKLLYQGRGPARFVDAGVPRLVVGTTPLGRLIMNTATGVEASIGAGDEVRRSGRYVVAWAPSDMPRTARLFEVGRLTELATWRAK